MYLFIDFWTFGKKFFDVITQLSVIFQNLFLPLDVQFYRKRQTDCYNQIKGRYSLGQPTRVSVLANFRDTPTPMHVLKNVEKGRAIKHLDSISEFNSNARSLGKN